MQNLGAFLELEHIFGVTMEQVYFQSLFDESGEPIQHLIDVLKSEFSSVQFEWELMKTYDDVGRGVDEAHDRYLIRLERRLGRLRRFFLFYAMQ